MKAKSPIICDVGSGDVQSGDTIWEDADSGVADKLKSMGANICEGQTQTHHPPRSHRKTSSVPFSARTGYGPKTSRSKCLLGDKFRHQYLSGRPEKEDLRCPLRFVPVISSCCINVPNHFEPQKNTQLPTFPPKLGWAGP